MGQETDAEGNLRPVYRQKGTGAQIRDYLMRVDEDYEMAIWRAVKQECIENEKRYPTWESFRNYFNRLKRLELVIESRTEDNPNGFPYRYYRLNPRLRNSDIWSNPQDECERRFNWSPQARGPLEQAVRRLGRGR